jgi:hypothetical protein
MPLLVVSDNEFHASRWRSSVLLVRPAIIQLYQRQRTSQTRRHTGQPCSPLADFREEGGAMKQSHQRTNPSYRLLVVCKSDGVQGIVREAIPPSIHMIDPNTERYPPDIIIFDATTLEPGAGQKFRELTHRFPAAQTILLLPAGAEALSLLSEVVASFAIQIPFSREDIADAIDRLRHPNELRTLAWALHSRGPRNLVARAMALALMADPPIATEKKLRNSVGVSHTTFWRAWSSAFGKAISPRSFLRAVALLRICSATERGVPLEQAALATGTSRRTAERAARRIFGVTLEMLVSEGNRVRSWLEAAAMIPLAEIGKAGNEVRRYIDEKRSLQDDQPV